MKPPRLPNLCANRNRWAGFSKYDGRDLLDLCATEMIVKDEEWICPRCRG